MNEKIIEVLSYLSILRNEEGNKIKSNAYKKAISSISKYDKEIKSPTQAETLNGIGKSISSKIGGILNAKNNKTGVEELDNLSETEFEKIKTIYLLSKDKLGIGYVKATKLYEEGHRSLDSLSSDNKMLKYRDDLKNKISYKVVDKFYKIIDDIIDNLNEKNNTRIRAIILGSYCRGALECGDVDIVFYSKKNEDYVNDFISELKNIGVLKELILNGNIKKRFIAKLPDSIHFQCDIEIVNNYHEEFPYKLLYFTGPESFVRAIRDRAKTIYNYNLTNHEMTDENDNKIIVKNEREIFDILGIEYQESENRNGELKVIN